jgi:hypothetical protein
MSAKGVIPDEIDLRVANAFLPTNSAALRPIAPALKRLFLTCVKLIPSSSGSWIGSVAASKDWSI